MSVKPRASYFANTQIEGTISSSFLDINSSRFGEMRVAQNFVEHAIRPTWGVSVFRDDIELTGSAAVATGSAGEIKLSSGVATSGSVILRTRRRGDYEPGTTMIAGAGVRIPTLPTGNQDIKWGYFDEANGFGFGANVTGSYVFVRSNSSDTKYYAETDWVDPLNSSGSSGVSLTLSDGYIYHIEFLWYGYGDIKWEVFAGGAYKNKPVVAHQLRITGSISIQNPNQPYSIEVHNSGTASSLDAFVGGRGLYRLGSAENTLYERHFHHITGSYVIGSAINVWEPLLQIRKKSLLRGQANTVECTYAGFILNTDQNIEYKVTFDPNETTNATFVGALELGTESAIEVNQGAFSASAGYPIDRGLTVASKQDERQVENNEKFILDRFSTITLWARKLTVQATTVSADLQWTERW